MTEFTDKVVIVTGSSSGIGAGTAVEYAKQGARLVLVGRNEERLNQTAEQCQQQGLHKDKIFLIKGDLTQEEDCNSLVDKAMEKFGRIDILINNAAALVTGNIDECTIADLDFMYNSNVRSVFMVTKRAIPHLIKTKGSIVIVSGLAATRPLSSLTACGVSKAAVLHFARMLAQDLATKSVNVNCVTPGIIDTPIFVRAGGLFAETPESYAEFLAEQATAHPMQRVGNVADVTGTILYLTSQAASFITGAAIPIDGGRHDKC